MRPSGITDGIARQEIVERRSRQSASMRPSGITDGIRLRDVRGRGAAPIGFNEAVGYYRRNHRSAERCGSPVNAARFNEAVGYYRRNHCRGQDR